MRKRNKIISIAIIIIFSIGIFGCAGVPVKSEKDKSNKDEITFEATKTGFFTGLGIGVISYAVLVTGHMDGEGIVAVLGFFQIPVFALAGGFIGFLIDVILAPLPRHAYDGKNTTGNGDVKVKEAW